MATVVSGTWYFGYGDHFDAKTLKLLPPEVYIRSQAGPFRITLPAPARNAVIVHICGFGATDTRYFNPADEPKPAQ
jgi:hypothetical protein